MDLKKLSQIYFPVSLFIKQKNNRRKEKTMENINSNSQNEKVYWRTAKLLTNEETGTRMMDIRDLVNKWRHANAAEKAEMAIQWEKDFRWVAEVSANFNLQLGKIFGWAAEDSCTHCYGTGFFIIRNSEGETHQCQDCIGYGFAVTSCSRCKGTGYSKNNSPCPTCHGTGIFKNYKKPCRSCGFLSPTGQPTKGLGILPGPKITVRTVSCKYCGGWGSLNPTKNPHMQSNSSGVFNQPRINK